MENFLMASRVIEILEECIKKYGDSPVLIADSSSPNSICNPRSIQCIKITKKNEYNNIGDIAFMITDYE